MNEFYLYTAIGCLIMFLINKSLTICGFLLIGLIVYFVTSNNLNQSNILDMIETDQMSNMNDIFMKQ